jgi:tetratricopeptide (TPR) repeat protein
LRQRTRRTGAGAEPRLILAACAILCAAALGCRTPEPPAPTGHLADFDAPRPATLAGLLDASSWRWARGDLPGALAAAERALQANPRSGAAALREAELRAALARRAGDAEALAEARADVDALRTEHPDALAPRLAAARMALADGRRDEAAAEARALLEARPDWAAVHSLLSEAIRDEDPKRALDEAEKAAELAPSDPIALAARARSHAALAENDEALGDVRRALRLAEEPELQRLHAELLLRGGNPRPAADAAERVLEAERSARLEIVLARAYFASGRREDALEALERARGRAGDDASARAEALELEVDLGISEGAAAHPCAAVAAARTERPAEAELAALASYCEITLGRASEAEASARRAVELAPDFLPGWKMLADVLHRSGARPPARERARAALGAGPDDARADALAGAVAEQAGDSAAARAAYEAALAREPGLPIAQLGLARILAAQGEGARAVELAESARKTLGWSLATGEVLGLAFRAAGRATDAVIAFRVACAHVPPGAGGNEGLVLELARALEAAGEPAAARQQLAASLRGRAKLDPEPEWHVRAREMLKRLRSEGAPAARGAR